MDKTQLIHQGHIVCRVLQDDGTFPNNSRLPVIIYKGALLLHPSDDSTVIKKAFEANNWTNAWVDGIYDYQHYHSVTHEVLGIFCGTADVQLGGPHGVCVEVNRGDVILIPAGVAHKCLKSSHDFLVVGAYPDGIEYDLNYGKDGERPQADENISRVPLPEKDPVYGDKGPLKDNWK